MHHLLARYYAHDVKAAYYLAAADQALLKSPDFSYACPIMMDWDPTQFVVQYRQLTGLVDTELYVVGPPQLELCALEYVLEQSEAQYFGDGYRQIGPLPDLTPYRFAFRVFLRLISFQGAVDWEQWMGRTHTLALNKTTPV
jgi:hypothetical protein